MYINNISFFKERLMSITFEKIQFRYLLIHSVTVYSHPVLEYYFHVGRRVMMASLVTETVIVKVE